MLTTSDYDATTQFIEDAVDRYEAAERRTRLLSYIQDMRDMLALWGSCVPGERPQAYRDRWSCLCRQLCEDGKPVLNLVSA